MTVTETGPPAEGRSVASVAGDDATMRAWAEELVARARAEGIELTGDNGLLTGLVRQVLQTGLEVEMTDHLGYERHAPDGRGSGTAGTVRIPRRSRPISARLRCECDGAATPASTLWCSRVSVGWTAYGGR
jgi:hypothetical protein